MMNRTDMTEKSRLMKKVGNLHQVIDVVPVTYRDGRADNLSAWQIKNGPLAFTVMKDKCLDIAELSYRGINFSFLSKPGMQGRTLSCAARSRRHTRAGRSISGTWWRIRDSEKPR